MQDLLLPMHWHWKFVLRKVFFKKYITFSQPHTPFQLIYYNVVTKEVQCIFFGTKAPLQPASSESLYVCITLAPLPTFPHPHHPTYPTPTCAQLSYDIIQINIQPKFSRIWDWFSIRRILFQCFLLQNHPFIA